MWPPLKKTCTSRKRRPMIRLLRKSLRNSPGRALVTTSKSLGLFPRSRSRTPPHQIDGITGVQQPVENLKGLHVDIFSGDGMLRPGDDAGQKFCRFRADKPHGAIIGEIPQFFNLLFNKYRGSRPNPRKFEVRGGIIDKRRQSRYF